jgi:hypothetical protein
MPDPLQDAIREAYATARTDVVYLDTMEISNPSVDSVYLVQDRVNHDLTLENGQVKTFVGCAFRFNLPATGENGVQELNIAIDNVDRGISDFLQTLLESDEPVRITYRPYLSEDPTQPQLNPPLVLFLTDVVINVLEVSGRAAFADVLNRRFLTETYNSRRFPSL